MLLYKPENEQSCNKTNVAILEEATNSEEEVRNLSSFARKIPKETIEGKINESYLESPKSYSLF